MVQVLTTVAEVVTVLGMKEAIEELERMAEELDRECDRVESQIEAEKKGSFDYEVIGTLQGEYKGFAASAEKLRERARILRSGVSPQNA
jgi:hypothetical protein